MTALGLVQSKEQPKKPIKKLWLKRMYCRSVKVMDTTWAGKNNIYLCMIMSSVDTSTVITWGYHLDIGPIDSYLHGENRSCSWKEAAERNWQKTSGFIFPFPISHWLVVPFMSPLNLMGRHGSWQTCFASSFIFPHILITSPSATTPDLTLTPLYFYLKRLFFPITFTKNVLASY